MSSGENASRVAHPDAVGGPAVEADVSQRRAGSVEQLPYLPLGRGVIDDQLDPLVPREIANDFRVDPGNRLKLAGPVAVIVRPGQPGSGVEFPFSGHAEVEGCRGNT